MKQDESVCIVDQRGNKKWWVNGKLHRLDGPAVETPKRYKEWWINGVQYTEDEFNIYIKKLNNPILTADEIELFKIR
jgi:hypothetical protein